MTTKTENSDPKAKAKWQKTRQKIKGENKGYYVLNKLSYYDPKTKNTKYLKSHIIGWVPSLDTPFEEMVPTKPKTKKEPAAQVKEKSEQVPDQRAQHMIVYPLPYVLLVILLATLAGFTSCVQIAAYWKANREKLSAYFPDFPQEDISHDTVRRLIVMIGPDSAKELIERLTKPLVGEATNRLISVDGQAVRASRDDSDRSPYILNVRDTTNCLTLTQQLIGAKENEITHASELIKTLEIRDAVVIADALNTQKDFAEEIILGHADYILALKSNHPTLFEYVKGLFEMNAKPMLGNSPQVELGHGRIETRSIRVLPASRLPRTLLKPWLGLDEGCLIQVRKEVENKKTGARSVEFRYYISSLLYEPYNKEKQATLLQTLATYIRQHWTIENNTHWVLDVVFNQDRLQSINPEYLQGRTALTKIGLSFLEKYREILRKKKQEISITTLKVMMTNIDNAIACLENIYATGASKKSSR